MQLQGTMSPYHIGSYLEGVPLGGGESLDIYKRSTSLTFINNLIAFDIGKCNGRSHTIFLAVHPINLIQYK